MGAQQSGCFSERTIEANCYKALKTCHGCTTDVIKSLEYGVGFGSSAVDDDLVIAQLLEVTDLVAVRIEKINTIQQRLEVLDHSGWLYRDWIRLMLDSKYEPQRPLIAACRIGITREMFACDFDYKTAVKFKKEFLHDKEMFQEERSDLECQQNQLVAQIRSDIQNNIPFWISKLSNELNKQRLKSALDRFQEACDSSNFQHAVILHQRKFKRLLMRAKYGSVDLSDGVELSHLRKQQQQDSNETKEDELPRRRNVDNNRAMSYLDHQEEYYTTFRYDESYGSYGLSPELSMPL